MKKFIKSLLVLTMAFALVSCGAKKEEGSAGNDATSLANAERVKEGKIEVYAPKGKNTDYLIKAMEIYNKEFGTNLVLEPVDVAPTDAVVQKVTPKLVSNEKLPELMFIQDSFAGAVLDKFAGSFYGSDEYGFIKEHGKDFYESKVNLISKMNKDGKAIGFPNDWGTAVMIYNDKSFKEAGVNMEEVKDWNQLIEAGLKLKEKTGKKLIHMHDTGEKDIINTIVMQQGVSLIDENGNLNLMDKAVVRAYEIAKELIAKDLVAFAPRQEYTKNGQKCGIMLIGGWWTSYQGNEFPQDSGDWRVATMVDMDENTKGFTPMAGGSSFYVGKNSDNATAALQFITFALTDVRALEAYVELQGLPANKKGYETDAAKKGVEYYGGQAITLVMNEAAQNSVKAYVFPYSADLDNFIGAASDEILINGKDITESLKKEANNFASKYSIKVN